MVSIISMTAEDCQILRADETENEIMTHFKEKGRKWCLVQLGSF